MKNGIKKFLTFSLVELLVYAALVCAYFFFVLRLLGDRLAQLFHEDKRLYAALALMLIIGQGVVLEIFTRGILSLVKPRKKTR